MRKLILLLAMCTTLAACRGSSVDVNATANTPAQYSSVSVTASEVWFNESATAAPDDTTWVKFPLAAAVELDLATDISGTLKDVASQLNLAPGEYKQVRLFLADATDNQVKFFDSSGTETTLPLQLLNPEQGIGIQTDLKVAAPTAAILAALGSTATSTSTSTTTSTTGTTNASTRTTAAEFDRTTTTGTSLTGTSTTTTTPTTALATSSTNTTVTTTTQLVFDAAKDLTPFQFSGEPGVLLNPTLSAYDSDHVGTIQGTLDLSALTISTGTGRPDVQVTAEKLSDDSTRRVIVSSTPVGSNGAFVLFPLPVDSTKSTTTYDLVIHGPNTRTVIIRDVPVTKGSPDKATDIAIGTLSLTPSDSYSVNLTTDSTAGTRGSRVGFYQTLPDDAAPFLIELRTIDPLTGRFAADEPVSAAATVVFATYSTSSFTFAEAAPKEGAAKYSVATQAPLFTDSTFATTPVAPPATAGATSTFTVPSVSIPSTAAAGTIAATLNVGTPGKYDKGALFVTHDGAVVAVASLDSVLAQSQSTVSVTNVPASTSDAFPQGLYYLEAWTWSSADPTNTFTKQPSATPVDLRSALSANASVTVN